MSVLRAGPAGLLAALAAWSFLALTGIPDARALDLVETPSLADAVASGALPPVAERVPAEPLVVDLESEGLTPGKPGGEINMLMNRARDVRQMVVYGYARLVGYDRTLELQPDILRDFDVQEGRIFTFHLRKGHKWSDGHPFTAEDFRYWWEDMVTDAEVSKAGPPVEMLVDGEKPTFEVIDETTVRYTWSKPNPFFLPAIAGPAPLFIFKPAHYMKQFHGRHSEGAKLDSMVAESKQRTWVALHFLMDHSYKNENPDMPTLEPWMNTTASPAERYVFKRNPFYHRIDGHGHQLPYIDRVNVVITNAKLIPAKAGAGETDLQARDLAFNNYTFLKHGEKRGGFSVRLWRSAKGSQMALFPNLNANDPEWRALNRNVAYRRALSLAIDRFEINQVVYFGLALEANNTVLPDSPLYREEYARKWTEFDVARANRMLDDIGLDRRADDGIRLLPDGRPMEMIVELADVPAEATDVLELIRDSWAKVGIKLFTKPMQRDVFRNRVFAGETVMAVWSGLENGVPTADSSPAELAPVDQNQLQWPKWGQYLQTQGKAGEAIDMPVPKRLFDLNVEWRYATTREEKQRIWDEMLALHADNVFTIGLIAGVRQPIVVNNRLRNVPEKAMFNWDPGAHFGIYRPDQFWLDPQG